MTSIQPSAHLLEALRRHELDLPQEQVEQIEHYAQLLWKRNETLNLTRHTDYETFVARDVLDSVQLSRLLTMGERVLDIGSGGGVPGVLLSILRPDVQVALCECVKKKAEALAGMLAELELDVPVFADRSEDVVSAADFDTVVARAVGPMAKILTWMQDTWDRFDRMLLIKGPNWPNERGEARHRGLLKQLELRCVASYEMPGTESQSVILMIWPKGRDVQVPDIQDLKGGQE
ncbi:MAG: 16S rRNA (guanine(527)-N(7))-methyltransferase RsmG [Planctomycetales bacterium]|nr:16S rRNA (guanine(527)-N(7))-methyltransferase RsmG [Planctomycetales bacterium]